MRWVAPRSPTPRASPRPLAPRPPPAPLPQAGSGVEVRGLRDAPPEAVTALKKEDPDKEKSYVALCWAARRVTGADAQLLAAMRGLELAQQTPVRVRGAQASGASCLAAWLPSAGGGGGGGSFRGARGQIASWWPAPHAHRTPRA